MCYTGAYPCQPWRRHYRLGRVKDAWSEQIKSGVWGRLPWAHTAHRADVYEQLNVATEGVSSAYHGTANWSARLVAWIALVMYGRLGQANALITSLTKDKDAILQRSCMYTIDMAE